MEGKLTLFNLTWPIFIENFLRISLSSINIFMLSHLSDNFVGSVGVSDQIINMVVVIYMIIGSGSSIIISQYLGAGKKENASKATFAALASNLGLGLVLSFVLAVFSRPILKIMNMPEELMDNAAAYLAIVGGASFNQAIIITFQGIARNYGYAKFNMYAVIGMLIINITGNYIVIFNPFGIPFTGVRGVAVTAVVSQTVAVAAMLYILFRKIGFKLSIKDIFTFPADILKTIVKIGFPAAGEYVSYGVSQVVTTYLISMMGAEALTTRVYTTSIVSLIWVAGLSIGHATLILIGQMVGANRMQDAYNTCLKNLKIAILANTVTVVIFALLGRMVMGIFTNNASIIQLGSTLLFIGIILEPGRAFNLIVMNSLRGAGDVRYPAIMSIISMWGVSVALCYLFGINFKMGLVGVWIAFAIDEWFRGLIMLSRWRSLKWQQKSVVTPIEVSVS